MEMLRTYLYLISEAVRQGIASIIDFWHPQLYNKHPQLPSRDRMPFGTCDLPVMCQV